MQVLRYLSAIVLGLAMTLGLFASLANHGLNRTFLKPEFISEQLVKADTYRFVLFDLLPSAIGETRMVNPRDYRLRLRANTIEASGLSTQQITDSIGRAVSPQDLELTVSPVAQGIGEYTTGHEDQVDLSTDIGNHIKAAVVELRALMRESDAYARLLEREFEPRVREITGDALNFIARPEGWAVFLFKGSPDTDDRMADAVMLAFTPGWLAEEVEEALDVLPAYFVGDSDAFEFNVRPKDGEVEKSLDEIRALILETDTLELLFTGVLEGPMRDSLSGPAELEFGIEMSAEDVLSAMRQAADPLWVQEQAETVVDVVSAYVVGRSDAFSIEVSLVQNASETASILTELAAAEVEEVLADLPQCDEEGDAVIEQLSAGGILPNCIPPGISVSELLVIARPAIANTARAALLTHVPDSVVFNEVALRSDLEAAGGQEFIISFDRLRNFYRDGWTYDQDTLRADLSNEPEILDLLDGSRSYLSEGYIHTYEEERAENGDNLAASSLDDVREWVKSVRRFQWPVYLVTAALLGAFGFVLGRTWSGRIGWASLPLFGASVLAYVIAGPAYRAAAGEAFEQLREDARSQAEGHFSETAYLAESKLVDLVEGAANEFVAAISQLGLVLAILALVTLVGVIAWQRYFSRLVMQSGASGNVRSGRRL